MLFALALIAFAPVLFAIMKSDSDQSDLDNLELRIMSGE